MSYRRDKDDTLHWQKWLQNHRDELQACGIPPIVLEDMRHWHYFLEHGYFTPLNSADPIIDVDRMSKSEAERLCLFLEQYDLYPDCSALNRLQFLLKRGIHAGAG